MQRQEGYVENWVWISLCCWRLSVCRSWLQTQELCFLWHICEIDLLHNNSQNTSKGGGCVKRNRWERIRGIAKRPLNAGEQQGDLHFQNFRGTEKLTQISWSKFCGGESLFTCWRKARKKGSIFVQWPSRGIFLASHSRFHLQEWEGTQFLHPGKLWIPIRQEALSLHLWNCSLNTSSA